MSHHPLLITFNEILLIVQPWSDCFQNSQWLLDNLRWKCNYLDCAVLLRKMLWVANWSPNITSHDNFKGHKHNKIRSQTFLLLVQYGIYDTGGLNRSMCKGVHIAVQKHDIALFIQKILRNRSDNWIRALSLEV